MDLEFFVCGQSVHDFHTGNFVWEKLVLNRTNLTRKPDIEDQIALKPCAIIKHL